MPTPIEQLANLGKRYNTSAVVEQGLASHATYEKHKDVLEQFAFGPEKAAAMMAAVEEIKNLIGEREEDKVESTASTRTEVEHMAIAKDFTRTITLMAPIVVKNHELTKPTVSQLKPQEAIDGSTRKMIAYLSGLKPVLAPVAEHFVPYFRDEAPMDVLNAALTGLQGTAGDQEHKQKLGPVKTAEQYVAKGKLLELIDEMNRVGKVAFAGQAQVIGQFNKDILWRSRRAKKTTTAKTEETATEKTEKKPADPS